MKQVLTFTSFLLLLTTGLFGQQVISQEEAKSLVFEDVAASKVLFFFIEDCPACQSMVHHVVKLQDESSENGLKVLGIYIPGSGSPEKFKQFVEDFQVNFPIVNDPDLFWVDRFKATVTPEVVLLDPSNRVVYQGALNNYYYRLGKHRKIVTQHYLLDAISALSAGLPIVNSYAEPIGCFIR